jgi:hypothetical protein
MTVKELISVLSLIHDQSKEVVLWLDEEEITAIVKLNETDDFIGIV